MFIYLLYKDWKKQKLQKLRSEVCNTHDENKTIYHAFGAKTNRKNEKKRR